MSWSKTYSPSANGWTKLQARIAQEVLRQSRELRLYAAVASVLVVALGLVNTIDFGGAKLLPEPLPANQVVIESGRAVEMKTNATGVHYYWVFQNQN